MSLDDKFLSSHQLAASLLDVATSRGVDKNKLLRGTRIFYQDIKSGHCLLSASQVLRLVGNARQQVSGYDCSFQLGRRVFPSNGGTATTALLYSRNLADALRILTLHSMAICPFMRAHRYTDAEQVHLVINDTMGCGDYWQFLVEAYFTAFVAASKLLLGSRIPFHFDFPFERPKYIQEYETNLGYRLNFNQPLLRIRVDRTYLQRPFLQHSGSLKAYALQQIRSGESCYTGFVEAVRIGLRRKRNMSLQEAAQLFAMSPATFKRKLAQHGVGFQQLQDELGRQQAIYLLQVKKLNNEDSASEMEFTDIPNFRRAVKRWTGFTPNQLRLG